MATTTKATTIQPGTVVTVEFMGVTGTKRRPAVVISTDLYHRTRPDVLLGLVTSQTVSATAPSDCLLQDWQVAGLRRPSAFRTFLLTKPVTDVSVIGNLSERDWQAVQVCLQNAIAFDGQSTSTKNAN